jgi:ABC-type oligopeptide transport system substrate-binding subunit
VLRTILLILLPPSGLLMLWLAIARPPVRADFVMAMEEPPTLDPQRVSWNNEIQLTNLMFEGLTRLNARTLQPEPAVASAWEFDAAVNTYTFHLRSDAVWSNGDRVRAAEFRDAWLRVLDAAAGPQYRSLLYVIDGAEAYAAASAASAGATRRRRGRRRTARSPARRGHARISSI